MEACGTSNYWGRTAQSLGHEVKLLHAKYVKAYVRRTKTDAADALVLADNDMGLEQVKSFREDQRTADQSQCTPEERVAMTAKVMQQYNLDIEVDLMMNKDAIASLTKLHDQHENNISKDKPINKVA
jgi:hypothetical protein